MKLAWLSPDRSRSGEATMWRISVLTGATVVALSGAAYAVPALTMFVDQTASYHYCQANASSQSCTVPANWFAFGFDDSGWSVGNGPFSNTSPSSTIFNQSSPANAGAPWAPDPAQPI